MNTARIVRDLKKWYQVTNFEGINYGYCKHCDTRCIDTKEMLEKYVEELLKSDAKITKKVRLVSTKKWRCEDEECRIRIRIRRG